MRGVFIIYLPVTNLQMAGIGLNDNKAIKYMNA